MLDDFLALFISFMSGDMFQYCILPFLFLAFLATVPYIIRSFFRR